MFGWLKKQKSAKQKRRLPKRELAPVEEIAEQGVLVADVAARMSVKNAIIMNALKRHVTFKTAEINELMRNALLDLAKEREADAEHIAFMLGQIERRGRSSWTDTEYGNDDNRTLKHRQAVYELVAKELRERAENPEFVQQQAERARDLAWGEIGDSLKERATHPYYSGGHTEEYQRERDARIQQLIEKDLTSLVRGKGKRSRKN